MRTQREVLGETLLAYIVPVGTSGSRFAVYVQAGSGLEVLWPSDCDAGAKFKDRLSHQSFTHRDGLPAYTFHLTGYGYSKVTEIAAALQRINPGLTVKYLQPGYAPSTGL